MSQAVPTRTMSNVRPLSRSVVIFVATNNRADLETRELGEDLAELRGIEAAYRLLMGRLGRARRRCLSDHARSSIKDLLVLLPDVRHDASFGATLSLARDAAAEARVVPMRRG